MNGIHDLGGMHGLGLLEVEENEPVFHHEWEGRVYSLLIGLTTQGHFNIDEFRHGVERMGASAYLTTTYYEHWLHSFETLLVDKGAITAEEYAARCAEMAAESGR